MGTCVSIGYYGPSINGSEGEQAMPKPDMHCPQCGGSPGHNNFWKERCLDRVVQKDITCCYKGCGHARKDPYLSKKIESLLAIKINKQEAIDAAKREECTRINKMNAGKHDTKNQTLRKEDRSLIISYYLTKMTIAATYKRIGCSRASVSFYRKLFRDGLINEHGSFIEGT